MKKTNRVLSLLLCLVMILGMLPGISFAAEGATNVSFVVSATEVEVGDTFTVTLSCSDMTVKSFTAGIYFDQEKLECVSIVSDDPDYPEDFGLYGTGKAGWVAATAVSTLEQANKNGTVGFGYAGTKDQSYNGSVLYTATFKALVPGEVSISAYETTSGTDAFVGENIEPTTVVVGAGVVTPSCDHQGKVYSYDSIGAGYHKVTCECGVVVVSDEKCSGGTADCTNPAVCEFCNTAYGEANGHTFQLGLRGAQLSEGTCTTPATYAAKCDYCDYESTTKVVIGETVPGKHADSNTDDDHVCDECGAPIEGGETCADNDNDHNCDVCGTPLTECVHDHFGWDDNNHWSECALNHVIEGTVKDHEYDHSFEYREGGKTNTHLVIGYCECGQSELQGIEDCVDANADGSCDLCHNHACSVKYFEGQDATCTEDGWMAYYVCEFCGKCFGSPDGDFNHSEEVESVEAWKTGNGKIPAGHTSEEVTYQNITATTHDVHYACCGALKEAGASHDFANADYKCECGKVQEFLLTVDYLVVNESTGMSEWKLVEFYVPYGANVMDAIHTMVDDLLPDGTVLHYVDEYYNGEATLAGFHRIDKDSTMPARELYAEQSFYYYGWTIYDGFESYVDTHGYLEGWNYIEEDFDDVAGGAWYYFAYVEAVRRYCRVEGLTRVEYPEMTINGITYEANKDALSYDANFIDATEAWFLFDENGKFQFNFTGVLDGHYYANGMQAWHPGAVEGMYFIGDLVNGGNIPANGDTYIIYANGTELVEGAIYNFTNGVLSGFEGVVEGKYYEGSRLMIGAGLVAYEGGYIYVRSNGEIVVNAEYYVPVNDLGIASGLYKFDENGFLVEPQSSDVNGVVDGYYYENGKIVYGAGLIEWEGNYYYVRSNGQVATGTYWITNANTEDTGFVAGKYTFDENGKMLAVKNGIIDGYYYVNNRIQYGAGLIELDGNFYYVRSNGQVATGIYWITNANTEETGFVAGKYTFDENGKMIIE